MANRKNYKPGKKRGVPRLVVDLLSLLRGLGDAVGLTISLMVPGRYIWALIAAYAVCFTGAYGEGRIVGAVQDFPSVTSPSPLYYTNQVEFSGHTDVFSTEEPLGKEGARLVVRYARNAPHLFLPYRPGDGYWHTFATLATPFHGRAGAWEVVLHFIFMAFLFSCIPWAIWKFYQQYKAPVYQFGLVLNDGIKAVAEKLRLEALVGRLRNLLFTLVILMFILVGTVDLFRFLVQSCLRYEPIYVAIPAGAIVFAGVGLLGVAVSVALTLKKDQLLPGLQHFIADLKLIWALGALLVLGWVTIQQIRAGGTANILELFREIIKTTFAE